MRSAKIYLVVVSYLAEYAARLFHSTSWFYPRKMSGISLSGAALAAAFALIVCASVVSAAPHNVTPYRSTYQCDVNAEIGTLCERCAKTTKSPIVYPMCCANDEEAREWCDRYLHFGIP